MKDTARGLAQFGRYGDNNLVHVSNQELRGLEQLTGRRFTKNPHTGLPEAFGWADLVPIAAGVAGTVVSGGNVGVGALAAGATRAGVSASQGKSTEQSLLDGIVTGATSYAGGQLLSGVGEAGAGAATGATGETATQGAAGELITPAGESNVVGAANYGGAESFSPATGYQGANEAAGIYTPPAGSANVSAANYGGAESFNSGYQGATTPASTESGGFGQMGARAQNVYDNPGAAVSKVGENVWNDPKSAAIFAGGSYAQYSGMMDQQKGGIGEPTKYDPSKYPERFPSQPRQWNAPGPDYQPGYSPEYRYFAKGGLTSLRTEGAATENLMNEAKAALLGEHPKPREAIERFRNVFGDGALQSLQDRLTGGRVRGAGGGLDDLVPGDIEGRQKVRLADSEFVLPADIVSAIGDGSTDHGVRRLHEMMDNIRKQKTGSTKQPPRLKGGTLVHEQSD